MSDAKPRGSFSELKEDEKVDEQGEVNTSLQSLPFPESSTNIFSFLTFWWVTPLVVLGKKRPLEQSDLWKMAEFDAAKSQDDKFHKAYEEQRSKGVQNPSLLRVFHRSFGLYFYLSGIIKLFHDTMQFLSPYLMRYLINFVSSDEPAYMGWLYAVGMFLAAALQSLFIHQYFQRTFRSGMHVEAGIISAVYRKTLSISTSARQDQGAGNVVNLMSNDTNRIKMLFTYLHSLWSGPLQIIVAFVMLYMSIGWASFAGLIMMVALIPANAFLARKITQLRMRILTITDERVKWTNEVILGIKSVKLYAWEASFLEKLLGIRDRELDVVKTNVYFQAVSGVLFVVTPVLVALATFGVFAATGADLTADRAFMTLTLLNIMRFPLIMLPSLVTGLAEVKVSVQRIEKFLSCEEIDTSAINHPTNPILAQPVGAPSGTPSVPMAVTLENASFSWNAKKKDDDKKDEKKEDVPTDPLVPAATADGPTKNVSDITLRVPKGSLCLIVGSVGSGKTSLLYALNGELLKVEGEVNVCGKVAYVAQEAWIQNMSLKKNILFGTHYNDQHYHETIETCALESDLKQLPGGDLCEIGERGINLSGGQKQRVNLARAVYSNADVYFMDDCLSAVDAHVGRHIFNECIKGKLSSKTRIVATHQLQYLPQADWVVVMNKGTIEQQGTYQDLIARGVNFDALKKEDEKEQDAQAEDAEKPHDDVIEDLPATPVVGEKEKEEEAAETAVAIEKKEPAKTASAADNKKAAALTSAEERATGSVSREVYIGYAKATGSVALVIIALVACVLGQAARNGSDWWLSYWSAANTTYLDSAGAMVLPEYHPVGYYIGIYAAFGIATALLFLMRNIITTLGALRASRNIHQKLVNSVLRAPMSFMDKTPTGRLLNRFTKDTDTMDVELPMLTAQYTTVIFTTIGSLVLVATVTPYFLIPIACMGVVYFFVQQYYQNTSRELKRLQSIARSPIFVHFQETLAGLSTIRAYTASERFVLDNFQRVDESNRAYWSLMSSNRWLGIRLEFIGNLIVAFAAMFVVIVRENTTPSIAGLSLSNALMVTGWLSWLVRMNTEFEMAMNSVERAFQYINIESEAPDVIEDTRPPKNWPTKGVLEFKDLTVKYRPDLPPVLHGLTCTIRSKEKVGIVGRTGAGKTTFVQSLFRLVEATEGCIEIDGIDISTIGLRDLRSKIAVVPQDPVLFSGSIRFNLDPFGNFDDHEIWTALERVQLKTSVSTLEGQLDYKLKEGGSNFSVGERQLICMSRALLREPKILVMDEATANIDTKTDALIQNTIRTAFVDCTVLTIAHRLNTIVDSDRVMVLDKGEIAEFESPAKLLANPFSKFSGMVAQTGAASAQYLKLAAQTAATAKGKL